MYIAGADYGIKRIGGFLGRPGSKTTDEENAWEYRVVNNPDPFSKLAGPLLSALVLIAAIFVLYEEHQCETYFNVWIGISLSLNLLVWIASHKLNIKVRMFKKEISAEELR